MKNFINKKKLSEAFIGFSDGIIICSTVIIVFSTLSSSDSLLIKAAAVAIIAGMVLMAAGAYFSSEYRNDRLATKTAEEEEQMKQAELKKTVALFKNIGLDEEMQNEAKYEIEKDSKEWKEYVERYVQPSELTITQNSFKTVMLVSLSYCLGGLIPLLTWLYFLSSTYRLLIVAVTATVILFAFGLAKSNVNNEPILAGSFRLALIGAACFAAAYAVARVFTP